MTSEAKLSQLAALGRDVEVELDGRILEELADLALRVHHEKARAKGVLLSAHMARPFAERTETERAAMRSGVKHVVIALALLELIELPG